MLYILWSNSLPKYDLYRIANTSTLDLLIQVHYYIHWTQNCLQIQISYSRYRNHRSNKDTIYFHIWHDYCDFHMWNNIRSSSNPLRSEEFWSLWGKKVITCRLNDRLVCVRARVCESCNFEDEDTAAVLIHFCFQWITIKNTVTLSVKCRMSDRDTTALCLITILIFCQQWMEVMLDAGFCRIWIHSNNGFVS